MAWLEEVCQWGWAFRFQKPKLVSVALTSCCQQIQTQNSQLLLQHVFLHPAMLSAMTITDYASETVSKPQLNDLLYKGCYDQGISSQQLKSD